MALMTEAIRILGVDPGLRNTGWGVIQMHGTRMAWVGHGVIKPDTDAPMSERLRTIVCGLHAVIEEFRPDEAGLEETFVNVNPRSTLLLGQARGAAMAGMAMAGLSVAEFAPRAVKQCVVGTGSADKSQVGYMMKKLLPKAPAMTEDEADALAIAITTAHHRPQRTMKISA